MANNFDFEEFQGDFSSLGLAEKQNIVATTMASLSPDEKESTIIDNAKTLPIEAQNAVSEALPPVIGGPGQTTSDWIWKSIIGAFVFVFIATAIAMGYNLLRGGEASSAAFDKFLIMFTTVVSFLVGLLAPSPVKR